MNDALKLTITDLQVSEITSKDLEEAYRRVQLEHKDAIISIQQSMNDADEIFRKYQNESYVPLEDIAKKDRAKLNSAEKNIADKYVSLKAAYEKPLQNTEENIKMIRKAIKDASGIVDGAVKAYEEKQKTAKRKEIQAYFDSKNFKLAPLEMLFVDKWLNKGFEMKDIQKRLDEDIAGIYRDIEILEKLPEHSMAAKAMYLSNLNMGETLRQVEAIKENAERLANEQVEREERKNQEQVAINGAAESREAQIAVRLEKVQSIVDSALDLPVGTTGAQAREEMLEYTMTFKGTKEQLRKLREYMTANGISYHKGLLLDNDHDAKLVMEQKKATGRIYSFIYVPAA